MNIEAMDKYIFTSLLVLALASVVKNVPFPAMKGAPTPANFTLKQALENFERFEENNLPKLPRLSPENNLKHVISKFRLAAAHKFAEGGKAAPLLIDTDCGIDDAKAILLAAAHPERAKIVAVTTVAGKYVCPSFLSVHLAVCLG